MTTEIRNTPDNCIEVCVTEDGIRKCGVVSSMHLVYTKEHQLKQAISAEAKAAYVDP